MLQNICIYFSDTGGGHRSAVEAIEEGIRQVAERSNGNGNGAGNTNGDIRLFKECLAENSHPINRRFVELYNYLLRHHQPLMKYYYWSLHVIKPNESKLGYMLSRKYMLDLFKDCQPSVVVSAHPMINHYLARTMTELGLKKLVKLITVITDPNANLWRAWACPEADLTIAPNNIVADRLIKWGIHPERIKVVGMPVHPDFLKPPAIAPETFLSHLGLTPGILTVCINAGWAGGGNMLKVYRSLCTIGRPVQVIFLCGHNRELYERAMHEAAASRIPTAVLPFHDCMADLMCAVDIMVTKAGGLTTFQALARRLPMALDVITEPMPQEKGTVEMLVEQKLAYALNHPDEIVSIIESFNPAPDRQNKPLPAAHSLNRTDAIFEIADIILDSSRKSAAAGDNARAVFLERKTSFAQPRGDGPSLSLGKSALELD